MGHLLGKAGFMVTSAYFGMKRSLPGHLRRRNRLVFGKARCMTSGHTADKYQGDDYLRRYAGNREGGGQDGKG